MPHTFLRMAIKRSFEWCLCLFSWFCCCWSGHFVDPQYVFKVKTKRASQPSCFTSKLTSIALGPGLYTVDPEKKRPKLSGLKIYKKKSHGKYLSHTVKIYTLWIYTLWKFTTEKITREISKHAQAPPTAYKTSGGGWAAQLWCKILKVLKY